VTRITGTLRENLYLAEFFVELSVTDRSCRENQNTRFILHLPPWKSCRLWDNVGKCGRAENATGDNMAERRNSAVCKGKNTDTRSWYLILIVLRAELNILLLYNNAERTNCCISMATLNIRVLLTTTYTPTTEKRGMYCYVSLAATVTRTPRP